MVKVSLSLPYSTYSRELSGDFARRNKPLTSLTTFDCTELEFGSLTLLAMYESIIIKLLSVVM